MSRVVTRREFLGTMLSGCALLAAGCTAGMRGTIKGSGSGSVRLIFYTDVHARTEWDTPDALALAADRINAHKPDLIIAGGDLITDGFTSSESEAERQWEAYMTMHRAIRGHIYPAIGNHDLVAVSPKNGAPPAPDPRQAFRRRMGLDNTFYSFDAVGYHVIVLDSVHITDDAHRFKGFIWPEQLEWIKGDLSKTRKGAPIVIVTHIPFLSVFQAATRGATSAPGPNRVIVNNLAVLELFKDHHVILVLQGHHHVRELIQWRDQTFIVGGAVSGKWWRGPYHGTEEGFNVITLKDDGVHWEYVDYGWEARRP